LLWSFAYLAVRNLFMLVWLLARPRRSKELEILVLRHELAMLRRQARQPKLTRADRALLAALSRSLPRVAWAGFSVKHETLLRWHRQLVARRWTYPHRAPGRPPLESSLRGLIRRLGQENPHWGYRRIVGELKGLGISVSATSVRKVLLEEGLQPAPQRSHSSWRAFLRAQAASTLACDFLTVETAFLQRIYVLFFISLATRRIEYIASTSNPDGHWTAEQARNLVMQLGDDPFLFLIHDRDTKFSHAFDEIFRTEGIRVIRTPIQAPNANAHAERWVRTVRADCSTGSSSSDAATSSTSSASTAAITTSTGHTARSTSSHPTAATRRPSTRTIAHNVGISSADSSTNTRPPEFPNPTRPTSPAPPAITLLAPGPSGVAGGWGRLSVGLRLRYHGGVQQASVKRVNRSRTCTSWISSIFANLSVLQNVW
jgi:putative transposase